MSRRRTKLQRSFILPALIALAAFVSSCNDLTEVLPTVFGTYTYQARSLISARLNRNGTIVITDFNQRTANFSGTFDFTDDNGEHRTGSLVGAFVTREHIYFRFLNTHFEFHEADYVLGHGAGEIFVQGITYESTGATFTMTRR